jgi:3-dehydroquinate synthase
VRDHREINVDLDERSYPIIIGSGLLGGDFDLSGYLAGPDCLVVSDDTVAPLYLDALKRNLSANTIHSINLADGEAHKTLASVESVIDALVSAQANRDTTVIALGGGVIGDIAGFAAASYMRGVAFVQVPTTLLAQVDSSVGGKTGVNHPDGKNLIGAYHQPRLVLVDTDTLATLPERELRAGLAEVIKHAAIADAGFFQWLEANIGKLLEREPGALAHAIQRCCEIKAGVVAEDEREKGKRAILNFGHTFGHAIENCLGYGEWLHGEAVAAGMVMATELSDIDDEDAKRVRKLIGAAGLPVRPPDIEAGDLRRAMGMDKKVRNKQLRFVLLQSIGTAFVTDDIPDSRLNEVLSGRNGRA